MTTIAALEVSEPDGLLSARLGVKDFLAPLHGGSDNEKSLSVVCAAVLIHAIAKDLNLSEEDVMAQVSARVKQAFAQ
jgi:hypothetical protein